MHSLYSSFLRWSIQPRSYDSHATGWGSDGYDALVFKTDMNAANGADGFFPQFALRSSTTTTPAADNPNGQLYSKAVSALACMGGAMRTCM